MKYLHLSAVLILTLCIGSCKKSDVAITPLASINIVNASVNLGAIKANFTGPGLPNYYAGITSTIGFGANTVFGVLAGTDVPLTIVPADTTHPVYNTTLNIASGSIYTLFLAGQSTAVDAILVQETIPSYTDSVAGVRFINLSYNSNPIIVTQSATPTVTDFASLAYKQYSSFKTYPALAVNGTYTFQVRDAGTNAILVTYALTTPRFFNVTLVFKGMIGGTGTNAPGVQRVNNY